MRVPGYGVIVPQFWTGETGREIRGHPEAQALAAYLCSNHNRSMTGIFYLPLLFVQHELGWDPTEAIEMLTDLDFCAYDTSTDFVWIPSLTRIQVGERLKSGDNRRKGLVTALQEVRSGRGATFLIQWFQEYGERYGITMAEVGAPKGPKKTQPEERTELPEITLSPIKGPFAGIAEHLRDTLPSPSEGLDKPPRVLTPGTGSGSVAGTEAKGVTAKSGYVDNSEERLPSPRSRSGQKPHAYTDEQRETLVEWIDTLRQMYRKQWQVIDQMFQHHLLGKEVPFNVIERIVTRILDHVPDSPIGYAIDICKVEVPNYHEDKAIQRGRRMKHIAEGGDENPLKALAKLADKASRGEIPLAPPEEDGGSVEKGSEVASTEVPSPGPIDAGTD